MLTREQAVGNASVLHGTVSSMADRLRVVQAALMMALEGVTRATATEVSQRAMAEYNVHLMPSVVGQIASSLDIRRVTSHGRCRLVLDSSQLEPVRESLEARLDAVAPRVEETASSFRAVAERVGEMEDRIAQAVRLARREPEVREYLKEHRDLIARLEARERKYQQLLANAKRLEQLEAACMELEGKVKGLPVLESRRQKLLERTDHHVAEEHDIDASERRLAVRKKDLDAREDSLLGTGRRYDVREAVVDLAEVTTELSERRKELDDVLKLLGEKKGLLSRMLGRDTGGNRL